MEVLAAEEALSDYTADQWGLVTTAQANHAGVDGVTLIRMRTAGLITTVRRGVHAATSAPEPLHRAEQALWLSLAPTRPAWERRALDEDGGVISHDTAVRTHGLGELVAGPITITVPRRRLVRDPGVRVRNLTLTDDEVTLLDGLPVTTVARTVRDLLDDHHDASHIADIIRGGYRRGDLDLDELAATIGPYARRYGIPGKDGGELLNHLLSHIGTSADLLTRPPAIATHFGPRLTPSSLQEMLNPLGGTNVLAALGPGGVSSHLPDNPPWNAFLLGGGGVPAERQIQALAAALADTTRAQRPDHAQSVTELLMRAAGQLPDHPHAEHERHGDDADDGDHDGANR